jgi:membrane fusion protein (multidrug efflux system)
MKPIARRAVIGVALLSLLGLTSWYGWIWWERRRSTEATDNAYVHADITAISPKVAGYVADVLVADNQVIKAGAILVRIADEDYRAQRDRAQAAVAEAEAAIMNLARRRDLQLATIREAEAAIDLSRADVELTRRDLGRSSQLVNQGWTPRSRHDEATANAERARANLERAEAATAAAREQLAVLDSEARQFEARLMEARANLRLAEIALAETVIRAPVTGVVGNRRVKIGE